MESTTLVGRAAELDHIVTALRESTPVAFVLAGAAGVGKTRLASEAAAAAVGLGFSVVHVAATQAASSIPFGPFARFLPPDDALQKDLLGLLRQVSAAITGQATPNGRLVLVVDDAHLLDDGSAALVHELVQAGACGVVATMRSLGPVPDPITALWKDGRAERLDLTPLTESDVGQLAVDLLGGPVAGATVQRLAEASGGNPLWLRELVTGATRSGALVDDAGMWTLRRALTAPDRLAEIIGARLDELAPDTMTVVELLAAGEHLDLALLEANTVASALEDAERQGLVEIRQDGRRTVAHLTHPIYGEVLRRRLPRSRLRRRWAVLAESLEATGARRREDLLRLVTWQLDAGLPGDPALMSAAARLAGRMSDKELAARLARAAFDVGGGVEAGLALGVAEFSLGRHAEAERLLAILERVCENDTDLSRVAGARAYNLSTLMGLPEAAALVLEQALAKVTESNARLRLLGRLATDRLFNGQPEAAIEASAGLLESADDALVGQGAYASSIASALIGRCDDAVALSGRGMAAYLRSAQENHQLPEVQLIGAVLGNSGAGRLGQALADAKAGYQACLMAGDREGQATFSLLRGLVLVEQGELAAASRAFLEGASINRAINDTGALRWCLGGAALAEGMAGHLEPSAAAVAELDDLPPGWMSIFEADLIDRGRAWCSVVAGEISLARAAMSQAAQRAAATQQYVAEARLLHDIARLGRPAAVEARLIALSAAVDGPFVAAFAAHATALKRGSASGLAICADDFESLGALLLAAEAASAAGSAFRAGGSPRPASSWSRRAQALLAACGDVMTPALTSRMSGESLTSRELEIAGLAAAGKSSRDIATTLVVSVRTVDNHLRNVYSKLGVANRAELSGALQPK